jgi:hypothetical protein
MTPCASGLEYIALFAGRSRNRRACHPRTPKCPGSFQPSSSRVGVRPVSLADAPLELRLITVSGGKGHMDRNCLLGGGERFPPSQQWCPVAGISRTGSKSPPGLGRCTRVDGNLGVPFFISFIRLVSLSRGRPLLMRVIERSASEIRPRSATSATSASHQPQRAEGVISAPGLLGDSGRRPTQHSPSPA